MPKKYQIHSKNADPRFPPIGKYSPVEFREDCAGSCRLCVKKKCVYGVFKDNFLHASNMALPEYQYICKSCYRCVQECTKGIFTMSINPDYRSMGDGYWTPDMINTTWAQAHTGKIPVSGAGYRGRFAGEGFDSIWADMSEIVRPTRDGIHGREYINTTVELSRRPMRLRFNQDMTLAFEPPPILEVPMPSLLQQPEFGVLSENVLLSMAHAAAELGNILFIKAESYTSAFGKYAENLAPCLTRSNLKKFAGLIAKSRVIELADEPGIESEFAALRKQRPGLVICAGVPLNAKAADRALALAKADVDTVHLYGTEHGREAGSDNPRYLKDMIREVHLKLVENLIRDRINLIFSGGIAMAEHMAKAIICGADAVVIDTPLLVALECRMCSRCKKGLDCPVDLGGIDPHWGSQRMVNLLGAWRNQLIEIMGASGIREARRVRGEVGRSLWFEDLERDNFGPIFGKRKVTGVG